ncbi:MAG: hypothetical protein K8H86_06070 [Ignavibacteriaceae bacterium]|nr:hypothetical protein [Ignavibacteriaceae bacterium]
MKKRNYFWIILVAAALFVGAVLLITVRQKTAIEKPKAPGLDEVERVKNLLDNPSFEKEFSVSNWKIKNGELATSGFDDIIKYDGVYSYSIRNDETNDSAVSIFQKIRKLSIDRKYSLFGFIKVEDADSARLELKLYDKDSLLVSGYSPSVTGTTDWVEQTAWLKTYLPHGFDAKDLSIEVGCVLFGNGIVWFDNVRLYSLPEKETIYNYDYNLLKTDNDKK